MNHGISLADARPVDMSGAKTIRAWEQSDEFFASFVRAQEAILESRHTARPDTSSDPAYAPYATVQIGGRVVAEIDNHGWVTTSNATAAGIGKLPDSAGGAISGPTLARARAEYLADRLGGSVVTAPTAMTQAEFTRLPQPGVKVDTAAMLADPLYRNLQMLKEARTQFLQQLQSAATT
jgi:hypothetical protein